ncbi:MAG: zinc-ribbon domain-containing protein [Dehalococcoidia bacterium]|nr:zinc-ribbon domain-containing protein [Dehalococcoidia bacterium]
MFCPKCGSENKDDGTVCEKCGAALKGGGSAKVQMEAVGHMIQSLPIKKILRYGGMAAIVIAFIAGILFDGKDPESGVFFEWLLWGILVAGVLAGLSALVAASKAGESETIMSLPVKNMLLYGAVLALFLGFLAGILFDAKDPDTSVLLQDLLWGVLTAGLLIGLSALIRPSQE